MLRIGVFTGEVKNGYVEIKMPQGEFLLARPSMAFPLISRVNKPWLDLYKDKFIAVIDYLNDNARYPLLVGLLDKENAIYPTDDYAQHFLLTEKYRIWVNDTDNKLVADILDDGKILIGNKDVTEPAVLGDKNVDVLNDLKDCIGDIISAIQNSVTVPQDGGSSMKASILASLVTTQTKLASLGNKITQTKSETIMLK